MYHNFQKNNLFKIGLSIFFYSFSYLPILVTLYLGGISLQGKYAIKRYDFDLLVCLFSLGLPQSIFGLSRTISLHILKKYHLFLSMIFFIILSLFSLTRVISNFDFAILFSSLLFSHALISRTSLLINSQVLKFQIFNALFPIFIGCLFFCYYPNDDNAMSSIFLVATSFLFLISLIFISDLSFKSKYELDFWNKSKIVLFISESSFSLVQQFIQFLFPSAICLLLTHSGNNSEVIGLFSMSYTIAGLIYAPATILGANIISEMYRNNGRLSMNYIRIIFIGSIILGIIFFCLFLYFKSINFYPIIFEKNFFLISFFPLLSGIRLIIPIIIWNGDNNTLLCFELLRFTFGVPFIFYLNDKSFNSFFLGIFLVEFFFSTLCLGYLFKSKKNKNVFKKQYSGTNF